MVQAKQVTFGNSLVYSYEITRTEFERSASWFSAREFQAMRCHAYGLAKTATLLGEDEHRVLHGNTLRGLEKLMDKKSLSMKRRRNVVKCAVELHEMEVCPPVDERGEYIQATLQKYVRKHRGAALEAAMARAIGDEQEARKIYFEMFTPTPLSKAGKMETARVLVLSSAA